MLENLAEIKNFIKERKIVTIYDLAFRFEADLDAMYKSLNQLIEEGVVSKRQTGPEDKCASCQSCCSSSVEVYEWIEK